MFSKLLKDKQVTGIMTVGVMLIVIGLSIGILSFYPNNTWDDAFITFRYASNLADYGEFTYNVGEDPVEGYTGVLLPVVLAGFIKLGVDPILCSRAIGIIAFFVGGVLILLFLGTLQVRNSVRALMFGLYFLAPIMFFHAVSGMETLLFSTLVLACAFAQFQYLQAEKGSLVQEVGFVLIMLLASLTRPEGVVFSACCALTVIAVAPKHEHRPKKRFLIIFILLYILPGMVYFGWRWDYYGQLLPNTYYIKGSSGTLDMNSIKSFIAFAFLYLAIPTAASSLLILSHPRAVWKGVKNGKILPQVNAFGLVAIAIIVFVIVVLAQYSVSNLITNERFRFYVFLFPLAIVVIGTMIEMGLAAVPSLPSGTRHIRKPGFAVSVAGLLLIVQFLFYYTMLRDDFAFAQLGYDLMQDVRKSAGRFLRQDVPRSGKLAIHFDAGAIPYYSRLRTWDFGGLNDEVLSRRHRLSLQERVDYFFSVNADAVVFTSYSWERVNHGAEAEAIVSDDRFGSYVLVKKFGYPQKKLSWRPLYFLGGRTNIEYCYFAFLKEHLGSERSDQARDQSVQHEGLR
jgi:arabinofuranosyltransferase